jgi:hypothetical protein
VSAFVLAFYQQNKRAEEGDESIQSDLTHWTDLNTTETIEVMVLFLIMLHLFTLIISNANDKFESVMDRADKASYHQLAMFLLDLELIVFWKTPKQETSHLIFGKYREQNMDNTASWRH